MPAPPNDHNPWHHSSRDASAARFPAREVAPWAACRRTGARVVGLGRRLVLRAHLRDASLLGGDSVGPATLQGVRLVADGAAGGMSAVAGAAGFHALRRAARPPRCPSAPNPGVSPNRAGHDARVRRSIAARPAPLSARALPVDHCEVSGAVGAAPQVRRCSLGRGVEQGEGRDWDRLVSGGGPPEVMWALRYDPSGVGPVGVAPRMVVSHRAALRAESLRKCLLDRNQTPETGLVGTE